MKPFHSKNGELNAEDVALSKIAQQFATPTYVYSRSALEASFKAFQSGFIGSDHLVCFAVKANPSLAILNLFAKLGAGFGSPPFGRHFHREELASRGSGKKEAVQGGEIIETKVLRKRLKDVTI